MVTVVKNLLPYLSTEYSQLYDELREVLYGSSGDSELWKKCVDMTVDGVGFAAGALFVENHFTPKDKEEVGKECLLSSLYSCRMQGDSLQCLNRHTCTLTLSVGLIVIILPRIFAFNNKQEGNPVITIRRFDEE